MPDDSVLSVIDPLIFGHRVRHLRKHRGWTLDDLGARVGRTASFLSQLENGKKEPRLGFVNELAEAFDVPVGDLLSDEPPTRRSFLEVALERAQTEPLYRDLGLPTLRPTAALPDLALEHIVRLYDELRGRDAAVQVTRDEARIANATLRSTMQRADNYFEDIEALAGDALDAIDYGSGAITERDVRSMASHFGFVIIRARDLPPSVRSVTDLRHGRIYVPQRDELPTLASRSVIMQTLGHHALGHEPPPDFGAFLRQRIEANYFAGAVLVPERPAVSLLAAARERRDLAPEDLRDAFSVSYEMAAHRFTNLATRRLDVRCHFVRSDRQGIVWKAYANDGVPFPHNSVGAIEGQRLCRWWGARSAFESPDRYAMHYQYTDTPAGTFWCATHIDAERHEAVTIGSSFEDAGRFRGHETDRRAVSACPEGPCCRRPDPDREARWRGKVLPAVRLNSHLLAAMPVETIPGVDVDELYEFLDRQAPGRRH